MGYTYKKSYILASDGPEKLKVVSKDCFNLFYKVVFIYINKNSAEVDIAPASGKVNGT